MLGLKEGQSKEVRILNKVVRMTKDGLELEADPRHVELAIRELKLENAKVSVVPGAKPVKKKTEDDIDEGIDNIHEAKNSDGDRELEMPEDEGDSNVDCDDPELGPVEAKLYVYQSATSSSKWQVSPELYGDGEEEPAPKKKARKSRYCARVLIAS